MDFTIIFLFTAGAFGALVKDVLKDNKLEIPKIKDGSFYLGFLGSMLLGATIGYLVDGNPLTAFTASFTGSAVLENLISRNQNNNKKEASIIEGLIKMIAKQEGVDPELAVRVAKCESNLNPNAKHVNPNNSIDRGVFQINNKWHPEVSDEQAYDVVASTRFFCKAFKEGHLDWWNATKKCWDK